LKIPAVLLARNRGLWPSGRSTAKIPGFCGIRLISRAANALNPVNPSSLSVCLLIGNGFLGIGARAVVPLKLTEVPGCSAAGEGAQPGLVVEVEPYAGCRAARIRVKTAPARPLPVSPRESKPKVSPSKWLRRNVVVLPAGPHLQVQAAVRLGDGERAVGRPECGGQPGDRLTALRPKAPAAEASGLDTDASWKTVAAPIVSVFPDSRTPKPLAYTARALHGRVDSDRSQRLVALTNSERKNPQASSRYSL
jgi:hypothetical protein